MTLKTRVRMQNDFSYRLIEKYFEQLVHLVRVLRPHCRYFKGELKPHIHITLYEGNKLQE